MSDIEWNGEGVPPVGVICEASLVDSGANRSKIKVLYQDQHIVVGEVLDGLLKLGSRSWGYETHIYKFTPIKSDREIAIEQMLDLSVIVSRYVAEMIYDAGFRKVETVDKSFDTPSGGN